MAQPDRDVLPDNVKPINYHISIFDITWGNFGFSGVVKIELEVVKPTRQIDLNGHGLMLEKARLISQDGSDGQRSSGITHDEQKQRVHVLFEEEIPQSTVTLEITYTGPITNTMSGFYRSKYKSAAPAAKSLPTDGESTYMFSTQFESSDARKAIPCFDEPNLKASFDVEIEIPDDLTALSNMPVKSTRPGSEGRQFVVFERTPVMSTYLLAWAFGDFEYVEAFTKRQYNRKNLPVRVYTTRGLKEQGNWALEHAHQIVDYFSDIFQIEYPLPKVDLIAVHEFSHGAMENWGLITYRTTTVLFDEKQSDEKYRKITAYVVAHELAHQWFGNLVTMDWWSELWLNEGFATWVGWLATDYLHPDWEIWPQFVTEGFQTAFTLDSLRASHPIEVPVRDAMEVEQIFDAISYLKGSSVIRMLASHLGKDTFLNGVADYLKVHAYGNATTNDLWAALSEASGKDVNSFMDPWIRKIGFPVLTVAEEPGQISIRQSRFLSTGDVKTEEDETLWWIPLGLKTGSTMSEVKASSLTQKEETIRDMDDSFYKLNSDMIGFYRTNYPPARLTQLGKAREQLSVEDRIGLLGDAAALAIAGHGTTAGLLSLAAEFKDETNFLVWSQVLNSVGGVRSVFSEDREVRAGLTKFVLALVSKAVENIGWDFKEGDKLLVGQLRSLLITIAGLSGHEVIVMEAKKRFNAFIGGDRDAIHPNLRTAVLRIGVDTGGAEAYEAVKKEYLSTTSVDGKETCLVAMARVSTPELINDFLDFQFSEHVAIQDTHTGSVWLAANAKARPKLWEWFQANWQKIHDKLAGNPVVVDRYVKMSLIKFASHDMEKAITEFFKGKDTRAYERGLVQVKDSVKANANYRERDSASTLEWLKANDYA